MRRDADHQPGLPGVLPEEAPLPSEVILDGHVLDRRRREALAAIRALLIDRPDDIAPDEWRVVVATLAPPAAHLGRTPGGGAGRYGILQVARDCYPGLSASQAVARFREAQRRPHVAAFIADLRALEMFDVMEQRGPVRERLWSMIRMADEVDPKKAVDPDAGAGHCKAAMVATAAMKLLIEMDGLALRPEEIAPDDAVADEDQADVHESVREKVRRVSADLRGRAATKAGAC